MWPEGRELLCGGKRMELAKAMKRGLGLVAVAAPVPLSLILGAITFVILYYTRTQIFLGVEPFTAIGSLLISVRVVAVAAAFGMILGLVAFLGKFDRERGVLAMVMWSVTLFMLWFIFRG